MKAIRVLLKKNEDVRDQFLKVEGLETIIQATKHPAADDVIASVAGFIFFYFLDTNATSHSLEKGGIDCSLKIIESFQSKVLLVACYCGALTKSFDVMEKEKLSSIAIQVIEAILPTMVLYLRVARRL